MLNNILGLFIRRKKTVIVVSIVVLLIVWLIVHGKYKAHKAELQVKEDMKYEVQTWNLQVQVKVAATATLVNEQNLSFGQEWKITLVHVSVGDEVKAGDVLAELDMDDYYNAVQTSELELSNTQIWLEKLLNNDTSLMEA